MVTMIVHFIVLQTIIFTKAIADYASSVRTNAKFTNLFSLIVIKWKQIRASYDCDITVTSERTIYLVWPALRTCQLIASVNVVPE